MFLATDTNTQ